MVHFLSRRFRHRDSGAVAAFTAVILSVVFIGLCALVIDLGLARDTRRQAQNAADASVLAAGNVLYMNGLPDITAAVAAAKSYARKNYALKNDKGEVVELDWANCHDSAMLENHPVDTACISYNDPTAPSAFRVRIPDRKVATPFAGIWQVDPVWVNAVAEIQLSTGGRAVCGLCVLGTGDHSLGEGDIEAINADVMFNGTLTANNAGGSITVTGGNLYVYGDKDLKGSYPPETMWNQPVIADPLAALKMPSLAGLTNTNKTNSCTDGPGIYKTLTASTTPACIMAPGLYVVTGPSEKIAGGKSITALGVTLYFTCGTPAGPLTCGGGAGETPGQLDMSGGSTLTITAPATGPTAGIAIIADRENTGTFSYQGDSTVENTGTIYTLNGTLIIQGTSSKVYAMDSLVVAGDVSFTGGAVFNTSYTVGNNVVIPFSVLNLSQ